MRRAAGYTLIELVLVIVILSIISGSVYLIFVRGGQSYIFMSVRQDVVVTGRYGLERLVRELRGLDGEAARQGNMPTAVEFAAERIRFRNEAGETVTVERSLGRLLRNGEVLGQDVERFSLRYFDRRNAELGAPLGDPPLGPGQGDRRELRSIEIQLRIARSGEALELGSMAFPRQLQ